MITFIDEKGTEHSALVAYSVTNAVNGELSVKGTIYTNDKVLHGIGRGWRFRLDDEYFRITYAKPNDTGRQIEVEFDAVHQFFYDMSKSMVYTTLNGSKPFETYLQAIFSGSGYTYNLETTVGSIRKENFGNKSRLSLFNDIIKAAGLEFSVRGHVIRILKRIGTDLSTIVRKDFNMNELKIEKNINSFVTYQRGLGAWKDDEDHSKGRYETSYESPLSAIYGRIEADPIVDERYKDTGKLLERLKENVDKSYKVSVEIDMEDLSQAGYRISRPNPGDYIMAINETLGFRQKVRIVSFTSEYDVGGNLISRKVVCNDIGTVQRVTSEISHLSRTLTDSIEGSERALKTATKALVSADGKNTNYFGDVKPLDVPKGTLRKGDRLFLTVGDKKQLYFWNGAEWELEPTEFDHEKFDMEFNRNSQEIKKTIQENRQKVIEALQNAGASSLLAHEAQQIGYDAIARLEAFKDQTYITQSTLTGNLDLLKQTVNNEVNQASEHRRTTTEALSRMTGQMNGFATKSEVKQGIDGLTQTFAKMKVGGTNLLKGSKGPFMPDRKPANFDNSTLYVGNTSIYMEQGQEYIVSAKTDGNFTAHHDGTKESDNVVLWIMDKDVRNYQIVSDLNTGTTGTKFVWNRPTGIYHLRVNSYHKEATKSVWDVKIEKGTVATDWSPAIEDVESQITEARTEFKQTADGLSTKMATVENYVNQDSQRQEVLRKYTREESARQVSAVRELINRNFVGKATYQEDVKGFERKFEAITNPQNGSIATQIATYKNAVDGRFTEITSLISSKASQADFQRVKETSQLYERILGNTNNSIADNIARMALTNQLFQVEVGKYGSDGINRALNTSKGWTSFITIASPAGINLNADLHKVVASGLVEGDKLHMCLEISIDDVQPITGKTATAVLQSWGDVKKWNSGNPFGYRLGNLIAGNNWRKIEYDVTLTEQMLGNNFWWLNVRVDGASRYKVHTKLLKIEKGSRATPWSPAPEDTDEAIRTVQSQLAGSWSVQNLTSAGAIASQINATNNQVLIEAEKIRFKGKALLDELTAIQGYFKRLFVGDANVGTLNSDIIRANSITADKLVMDMAMARMFVSSDIFTDTLAAKEAFINQLRSVVVSATLLEGFKGRIGGFQIGTHDKDPSTYWLTGQNQFYVGMSNGAGKWGKTALWVNWGTTWETPGNHAWFVKESGEMNCYNTAHFWNTPQVHGDLVVSGNIFYNNKASGGGSGYWISSPQYKYIENSNGYLYLYWGGTGYDWIPLNKEISDRRYKHNIEDSTASGLDAINNLKTYSYRKEYDGKIEDIACGIMAQDVQKYAPEAFFENPDGAYSYNTFALIPYLIKAIQELNQKIEKLEKTA